VIYRDLGVLADNGVVAGDRVVIYMPMVPEAIVAMLACARIGAVHVVVFGGFAAEVSTESSLGASLESLRLIDRYGPVRECRSSRSESFIASPRWWLRPRVASSRARCSTTRRCWIRPWSYRPRSIKSSAASFCRFVHSFVGVITTMRRALDSNDRDPIDVAIATACKLVA